MCTFRCHACTCVKLLSHQQLRKWSKLRSWRNFGWLGLDYTCVLLVAGCAVAFHMVRQEQGFHWAWEVPVALLAVFCLGILQHRIGIMGHEASHGLLLPNRGWNDRVANFLIFYPLFSDIRLYRKRHLGHHLHPNDHEQDPNLSGSKIERIWAKFPMEKQKFARCYYLMFFWPPFVLRNLLDLFLSLTAGAQGKMGGAAAKKSRLPLLGWVWFILTSLVLVGCVGAGVRSWPVIGSMFAVALLVWAWLPTHVFSDEGRMTAGELKRAALQKLSFNALLLLMLGWLSQWFGGQVIVGFVVLWVCPLLYVFPYLMLLREIYQHANAGTEDLNNSRIMHVDPFTRWALLGYGNDYHLIHHLYPNIPHDRLAEVHDALLRESSDYAAEVAESYGVVSAPGGRSSILDMLAH
jgi:fatty acid desaturase